MNRIKLWLMSSKIKQCKRCCVLCRYYYRCKDDFKLKQWNEFRSIIIKRDRDLGRYWTEKKQEIKANHDALKCTECGLISVYSSNMADGHMCPICGGYTLPIGKAIVIK